ncbi:MAG: hypothetical protein GY820_40910, partial [Gammaproteobacteria bacterium]|nr:hypothetical protein [Gammaproteobacteria bacterium]
MKLMRSAFCDHLIRNNINRGLIFTILCGLVLPSTTFANLLPNDSFEDGTTFPFLNASSIPLRCETATAYDGSYALRIGRHTKTLMYEVTGLAADTSYEFYARIYRETDAGNVTLSASTASRNLSVQTVSYGTWEQVRLVLITTADETSATLTIAKQKTDTKLVVYIDTVTFASLDEEEPDNTVATYELESNVATYELESNVEDTTGSYDATLTGSNYSWVTGVDGSAIEFDASDTYMTLPSTVNEAFNLEASFEVKFDFKTTSTESG